MLKDMSCYSNPEGYIRAFFLHNSKVQDYLVDPVCGSFVRVVTPTEDQPEGTGFYSRPQFMFCNKNASSRFYEIKEAIKYENFATNLKNALNGHAGGSMDTKFEAGALKTGGYMSIYFNTATTGSETLVCSADYSFNGKNRFTKERNEEIINNLIDIFSRIKNGLPPKEEILKVGNDMMTTLHRPDMGVKSPIIISGYASPERESRFAVVYSNKERLCLMDGDQVSIKETVNKFMDKVQELATDLLETKQKPGRFAFIGEQDINMEYVSVRLVDYTSEDNIPRVIINSDRYPANTKFSYHYSEKFHAEFKDKLISFAEQFAKL